MPRRGICYQLVLSIISGFEEHTKQLLTLLPLRFDPIILIKQISEEVFLVELTDQPILHNIFAVVDEQVHDRFGDLVGDGLTDNVEVGRNEGADEFCLQSFPFCKLGIALRWLRLLSELKFHGFWEC